MMKVVCIVGESGSGKTTFIEHMVVNLKRRGLRASCVKRTHHDIEIDHAGKDSWRMKQAGAFEVVLVSQNSMSLQRTFENEFSMTIHQVLAQMYEGVDWVIVEGFKDSDILKIEVVDAVNDMPHLLCHADDFVVAVVCSERDIKNLSTALPLFDRDQPELMTDWLLAHQDRFIYSLPLL
jgi:molybdopterin-guanine dinucleotide biosynthesis protein B